jgi:hypothetical protein
MKRSLIKPVPEPLGSMIQLLVAAGVAAGGAWYPVINNFIEERQGSFGEIGYAATLGGVVLMAALIGGVIGIIGFLRLARAAKVRPTSSRVWMAALFLFLISVGPLLCLLTLVVLSCFKPR